MVESAALLVDEVFPEQPVRQWVVSVPFPLRFLFASPEVMDAVLGIVYRCIATHLIKKAGFSRETALAGAVTYLERQGLLERDAENSYLAGDELEDGAMAQLLNSSIIYRIAVGQQQGRKVCTLQTLSAYGEFFDHGVGKVAGFSLHAGVSARVDERQKLERLCRSISRPAISEKRLSLTPNGNVRYQLKTPYRDGTTHVIFEPLDNIAPGDFVVPNSRYRARVTPAKRGTGGQHAAAAGPEGPTPAERRAAMSLKRSA